MRRNQSYLRPKPEDGVAWHQASCSDCAATVMRNCIRFRFCSRRKSTRPDANHFRRLRNKQSRRGSHPVLRFELSDWKPCSLRADRQQLGELYVLAARSHAGDMHTAPASCLQPFSKVEARTPGQSLCSARGAPKNSSDIPTQRTIPRRPVNAVALTSSRSPTYVLHTALHQMTEHH